MADSAHNLLAASRVRLIKDRIARYGVTAGGVMVLVALLLIFFYLLYVVFPVFRPVTMEQHETYAVPGTGKTLALGIEEQNEIGFRLTDDASVVFFAARQANKGFNPGDIVSVEQLSGLTGELIVTMSTPASQTYAIADEQGQALVVRPDFRVTFPNDVRQLTPFVSYPLGEEPLQVDQQGQPLKHFVFERGETEATFAAVTADNRLIVTRLLGEEDFMTEEIEWQAEYYAIRTQTHDIDQLLITPDHRMMFVRHANLVDVYDISQPDAGISRLQTLDFGNTKLTYMDLLSGASSIMIAEQGGTVSQWFQVLTEQGREFTRIRDFDAGGNVSIMTSEFFRRGFMAGTTDGQLSLFHSTGDTRLVSKQLAEDSIDQIVFSPRADSALLQEAGQISYVDIYNPHPEVTWSALWQEVWYEGYKEPDYIWQSTSGSDDFEAKMSLVPISFGTIKAAFYAMLFAVPLALAGAIYTAYFMAPEMRTYVKPTVEIMEALPTVILGFLAGLWLAPLIEGNLPGVMTLLIVLPAGFLAAAWGFHKLPKNIKQRLPEGWDAAVLIPVVIFLGWFSFAISPTLEMWLMGGDARGYITNELGISFDQRNSLVVGIAMGFAVIPTIFSIAEDAVFSVPRHLSNGSLALGATPWQTLTRVVLLTASPGIFSAVMMGLGRAVGETMIVLMATGNTPLMDWSIFQGMRTLSANIAVEMPESEVGSSHYRVLFLSAFVLFIVTFVFNTISEFVRQRLRDKYSNM
ncbi:ABC transporter permease subunit [Neiella sp. HB171785]|uniref:ABC transporter permease subunit n=1 Tax=Neiella litorisoli TaxID=2771431 RepID=A0A8J6QLG5_9GAMM|nr:ABC transporter permease subunit [Neiella litorisoli]MBD1390357.1 ABC transporter permease subunit [Neiella litorisoli]